MVESDFFKYGLPYSAILTVKRGLGIQIRQVQVWDDRYG